MKFFIVLAAIVASASATAIVAGVANTGVSAMSRSEDGLGNYAFGYNEDHAFGGTFRKEKGGPGVQIGSYGLRESDGRMRVVNYVADALGFRASVSTNEPGTDAAKDPAAVSMNRGAIAVATPVTTPVIAKSFGAWDVPIMAKSFAAPIAVAAAPVTAHSFSTHTQHISAAPMIAKAAFAAPIAAPLAAPFAAPIAAPLAVPFAAKSFIF